MKTVDDLLEDLAEGVIDVQAGYDGAVQAIRARIEHLERVNGHLLRQAQTHAMEARTQRHTVRRCYQIATGATGEPGDWNGSLPVEKALRAAGS